MIAGISNYSMNDKALLKAYQHFCYSTFLKKKKAYLFFSSFVFLLMSIQALISYLNTSESKTSEIMDNKRCYLIQTIGPACMIPLQIILIQLSSYSVRIFHKLRFFRYIIQILYIVFYLETGVVPFLKNNSNWTTMSASLTSFSQLLVFNLAVFMMEGFTFGSVVVILVAKILFVSRLYNIQWNYWIEFYITDLLFVIFFYFHYRLEQQIFSENYHMRRNGEAYETFFNLLPEGVAILMEGEQLRYVNNSMQRILGCNEDQIVQCILDLKNQDVKESETVTNQSPNGTPRNKGINKGAQEDFSVQLKNINSPLVRDNEPESRIELVRRSLVLMANNENDSNVGSRLFNNSIAHLHTPEESKIDVTELAQKTPKNSNRKDPQEVDFKDTIFTNSNNGSYIGFVQPNDKSLVAGNKPEVEAEREVEIEVEADSEDKSGNVSPLVSAGGKKSFFRKKTFNMEKQFSSEISFVGTPTQTMNFSPGQGRVVSNSIRLVGQSNSSHYRIQMESSNGHNQNSSPSNILLAQPSYISSHPDGNNTFNSSPKNHTPKHFRMIENDSATPTPRKSENIPNTTLQARNKAIDSSHNNSSSSNRNNNNIPPSLSPKKLQISDYKLRFTNSQNSPFFTNIKGKIKELKSYTTNHADLRAVFKSLMKRVKLDGHTIQRQTSLGAQIQSKISTRFTKSSLSNLFSFGKDKKSTFSLTEKPKRDRRMKFEEEDYCIVVNSMLKFPTKEKYLEVKLSPTIIDEKACVMVLVKDTTERDLINRLKETDDYKNTLLASVSHELRTPLNCIITMQEMLLQFISENLVDLYLRPAIHSSRLLLSIVDDILDFAQIRTGKLRLSFVNFSIKKVLEEAITLFDIQAKNKGVTISHEYDSRISDSLYSDPSRIRQIVVNLLQNALKFTYNGTITIKTQYRGVDKVCIRVEDTGIGIKKQDIRQIFSAFGKVENDNLNPQGVGLGLTISQSLARRLGPVENRGIKVESEFGKGSCFYFMIESRPGPQENELDLCELEASLGLESRRPSINMQILERMSVSASNKKLRHSNIEAFRITFDEDLSVSNPYKKSDLEDLKGSAVTSTHDIDLKGAEESKNFMKPPGLLGVSGFLSSGKLITPEIYSKLNISFNPLNAGSNLELEHMILTNRSPRFDKNQVSKFDMLASSADFEKRKTSSHFGSELKSESSVIPNRFLARNEDTDKSRPTLEHERSRDSYLQSAQPEDNVKGLLLQKKQWQSSDFLNISARGTDRFLNFDTKSNLELNNVSRNQSKLSSMSLFTEKMCKCPDMLIVDDNDFNLLALNQILLSLQFHSTKAHNGEIAIQAIKKRMESTCCKAFSLVFMDCDMPVKNGFDTTTELRAMQKSGEVPYFPIVAVTAYVNEREVNRCFECGMDDYLNKPVMKDKLQATILKWAKREV